MVIYTLIYIQTKMGDMELLCLHIILKSYPLEGDAAHLGGAELSPKSRSYSASQNEAGR